MLAYTTPKATVQQVLQQHCPSSTNGNQHVQNVLHRLKICRTAGLGYHAYQCSDEGCGYLKYQYHSCRDRHCPNCGGMKKEEWIEARMAELLPVKYYHMVFTLPHELNRLVLGHRQLLYKLLFDASSQTLLTFAKDTRYLDALPGIISVLHTWGQQLSFHPHVHCIVSGGGILKNNTWKDAVKNKYDFLFPVKAMHVVYRAKFLEGLQQLLASGAVRMPDGGDGKVLISLLYQKAWVVYAKAPFGGPHAVVEYLGRYTHKVAISNHRISSINEEEDTVTFDYKDYRDGNKQKQMSLSCSEFIRRFEQHILPKRFTKIRTYGYLANRNRHERISAVLKSMQMPQHKGVIKVPIEIRMKEQYGIEVNECPVCKCKTLRLVAVYTPWKKGDDG